MYKNISLSCNNDEWGCATIEIYKKIICDIVLEYEQLGYNPVDNLSVIIQHSPFDYPMCSNAGGYRIIYLTTKDDYWCQLAYQFAHEYCHHLINGPMDGEKISSFWFEESICELSSIYFMKKIAHRWIREDNSILHDYTSSVLSYCENEWVCIPQVNGLSSWLQDNMSVLSEPNYHRDMYKVVAKSLHPIFDEYSDIWKLLPYLKRVPQGEYGDFEYWITNIVANKIPEELRSCFCLFKDRIINT